MLSVSNQRIFNQFKQFTERRTSKIKYLYPMRKKGNSENAIIDTTKYHKQTNVASVIRQQCLIDIQNKSSTSYISVCSFETNSIGGKFLKFSA